MTPALFLAYVVVGFFLLLLVALAGIGLWLLWQLFNDMRRP